LAVQKRIVTLSNKIKLLNKCAKFNKIMYHSKSLSKQYYTTKNFSFFTIVLKSNFVLRKIISSCKLLVNNLKWFLSYFSYIFKQLASMHFNDVNGLRNLCSDDMFKHISNIVKKTLKIVNIMANTFDRSTPQIFYEPLHFHSFIYKLINPLKLYYLPLDYCTSLLSKTTFKLNMCNKAIIRFNNSWRYTNRLRILNKYYPIYFSYKHYTWVNKNTHDKNLLVLNNLLKTCTNLFSFSKKKKNKVFLLP
jgi:hypothetical protein